VGDAQLVQVRAGARTGCIRSIGVTDPSFVLGPATKGTRTNIENIDEAAKYSWSSRRAGRGTRSRSAAPRYLVAYARGNKEIQEQVNGTLKALDVPITRGLSHARAAPRARARVPVVRTECALLTTS